MMDPMLVTELNPEAPEFYSTSRASGLNPGAPEFMPFGAEPNSMRPDAAIFIPTAGGFATLQAQAEEYARQKAKRQMPPATDEEWDMRISKREKEVETIKTLQSYRLYIDGVPYDQRSDEDPKTPNPHDRTVSKRMWKW